MTDVELRQIRREQELRQEHKDLVNRLENIRDRVKYFNKRYTPLEIDLYTQQLEAMTAYRNVLELRAKLLNINLWS